MPELQVFANITFDRPAPAEPVEAAEAPDAPDAPLPVVITPIDAPDEQADPEPDPEVRDGVAKAPRRRRENSNQ
jgi:hypothetical protein